MTQTTVPPVRVRARALVFVVAGIATLCLSYACAQTKRSPGEECLKSEDCLSGLCQQLVCASPGTYIDVMEDAEGGEADSGPAEEAAADDAAVDSGSAADSSGASETGAAEAGEASSGD